MVHFGTSGWRGVIGRDITFRKVRIVTQAFLDTLRSQGPLKGPILIGYDTRMLSEKFAATAARILTSNGISVETAARDCPSPVLAFAWSSILSTDRPGNTWTTSCWKTLWTPRSSTIHVTRFSAATPQTALRSTWAVYGT